MWTYNQSNGNLSRDGELIGTGYSGFDTGRNDPACEAEPNVGPIPRGVWAIGTLFSSETHGPDCLHLLPMEGTDTFGRSGFLMHGDSIQHPGSASHGCIIMPRQVRLQVAESGDTELEVV